MKHAGQPLCRFVSSGRAQHQQRFAKSLGHPRSRQQEGRESFGKNAMSTVLPATKASSAPQQDPKRIATTGKITKRPLSATVLSC